MMNFKNWQAYLRRDGHCPHCGKTDSTLIPQHRINRGMGGSKNLNRPSNIIVFCSYANGLIESDSKWVEMAREFGWKLYSWQNPEFTPVYDKPSDTWWMLDDDFGKVVYLDDGVK